MIKYRDPFPNYESAAGSIKHKNTFRISWSPDYFCNYKCSYCWPGYNQPTRSHLPIDVLVTGFRTLKNKIEKLNFNDLMISFSGGEPTLVPGFLDLIKEYNFCDIQKPKTLNLISNLTQGKRWWKTFLESTENIENVHISGSWHRESIKNVNEGREKFVEISNMINKHKKTRNGVLGFNVTIVIPPSQFDDIFSDALYFRKNKIYTTLRVERKNIKGKMLKHPDYTDDMIESITNWYNNLEYPNFFYKNKSEIIYYNDVEQAIALDKTNYLGWMCHAGFDYIIINPNGDIRRGQYCDDKIIGNIKNGDYELYPEPKKCITHRCGCSNDMNSIKFIEQSEIS